MKKFLFLICLALSAFSGTVYSQEAEKSVAETVPSAETDAGRVARINKVLASDKARLAELKKELTQRKQTFVRTSANVAEREANLEALQTKIEGTSDPAELAVLQAEFNADTEKHDLVKELADLALQGEKAVAGQIQNLEQKIAIDQRALDELLRPEEVQEIVEPAAAVSAPGQAPPQVSSKTGVIPRALPGMPGGPAPSGSGPSVVEKKMLPETAEQIEARKQAERSTREAMQAELAVLTFLERKQALQKQIDLEASLLATTLQKKEVADKGLRIRQRELDVAKTGGNNAEIERARDNLDKVIKASQRLDAELIQRESTLESFNKRMLSVHDEQAAVTEQAEQKREQAEKELQQSVWLDSALHPTNVMRWAMARGPEMIGVLVAVLILLFLIRHSVRKIARTMVGKGRRNNRDATTRADTLAGSFGSAATVIIAVVGIFLIFEAAGVDIATVLGGAAVLGVAIAFGAQNLMRDYFNGFIILIEDQYELNDLVTIGATTGRVESVSLRTTALRDLQGKLHFIPNGEIKSVTNRSYEWARIVFDIRVAYKENVDQVMAEMLSVAREVCADPKYKDGVIEEPQMLGVDAFTEFGVIVKMLLKTTPQGLFEIKRETLRRMKNRFDELGIEIPMVDAAALPTQ